MNVGIFLGHMRPEGGGAHTIQSELLESLSRLKNTTSHTFKIYGWSAHRPEALTRAEFLDYRCLGRSFMARLAGKTLEMAKALARKVRAPFSHFHIESSFDKFVLDLLEDDSIDVLWSFTHEYLTFEKPVVITALDIQHLLQPYFPEVSAGGEWCRREHRFGQAVRRASFVVTGTRRGKEEIERFYRVPPERIKILALPTPRFALTAASDAGQGILEKYQLPPNYLFYPAQFWPHKNHAGLLLAVQWLRDKFGLEFPVVFTGSDKGNLAHIQWLVDTLGLQKQVHFLGFVALDDMISLYRQAFALVFVSLFGPDNMPPLEAFALGCPVIASNVPGSEEQLADAALLVDTRKPEQIAEAIRSLHEDRERRQTLIQRGFNRAAQWTGIDYAQGILGILDEFEEIRRCWK